MTERTEPPHVGREARRDKRFAVAHKALIAQPGYSDIACEIRDFCMGGLFLQFANPQTALASLTQRTDADVEILFSPAIAEVRQTLRIPAKLRRLTPNGVGVAFLYTPTEALQALQRLRLASQRQALGAQPEAAGAPRLREATATLLADTLHLVQDELTRALDQRLEQAALSAPSIAERQELFDAKQEFQRSARAIQTSFVQQVLDALTQARPVQTQATADTASASLSLVDEHDFEDWLATSAEVNRLEEQFRTQLFVLEPRIGQLFDFNCDDTNNPAGPAVISHAYRIALQALPLGPRARQVAYSLLREILGKQLDLLYAELLALLPMSRAEQEPQTGIFPAPAPAAAYAAPTAQQPATPESAADAAYTGSTAYGAPSAPAAQQGALSRIAQSLLGFLRGQPTVAPAGAAPAGAAAGGPASVGAAGGVTGESGIPVGGGAGTPPPGLRVAQSRVLSRLAQAGALPANMNPAMQQSVDMFGALFDSVHAQKSVGDVTRPFFQQLETSLIKLALSDPQFLVSPVHPAHKVLNTLDRISMAASDDGKITDQRLLRLMNRWTERIHAEADKNPGVFEEARTQLERVVKPLLAERTARVSRLQEMCEGRQRAEVTKQRILRDLLGRLADRPVPNAVIELLNGGWRNVLLMAEMRHGSDSDPAHEAWQVLERLCAWLDPELAEPPPAAEVQTLLQRIDQALTQVCADKSAQDRIVDQLATTLFDRDKSQYQYTPVAARLNDTEQEALSEADANLTDHLRVGDWLQFKHVDTPLNLVWIGDQPPVYVFANYRGIKKLDLKRQDLLQALRRGDAEWTEDQELPLMDRSYSAMIQKMQRDLMWQAAHDPGTGLSNRRSFLRTIRRNWLRGPAGEDGYVIGVLNFDLQTLGGTPADEATRNAILRTLAQRLTELLPAETLLARSGESGLAYWTRVADSATAETQAKSVLTGLFATPVEVDGARFRTQAFTGLMWSSDCLHPETYYDNANAACARARESGVPVVAYSSEAPDSGVLALAEWAHTLTAIVANNQLRLNCQPVVATADPTRTPLYYEVLLHPHTGERSIATRDLIDVAERLGRIAEIDRWVLKTVLQWMRSHPADLARLGGLSVNLSGQSVTNPLLLKYLLGELARGDIPGDTLILEISEADAVGTHAQAQVFMRQLQRYGCRFTLDEFGAGTSSYTSLKSMRLSYLKIDRALVRELGTSLIDEALVRSILETGQFLGIKTVAGFVENEELLAKLAELGVDCVQGYLIGAPQPLESLG
ncbi:MAG: DUF1631 family protein [Thiobacillus sp.]